MARAADYRTARSATIASAHDPREGALVKLNRSVRARAIAVRESGSIVEIGMKVRKILLHTATGVVVSLVGLGLAAAADYPPPKEADWVARDFRFSHW